MDFVDGVDRLDRVDRVRVHNVHAVYALPNDSYQFAITNSQTQEGEAPAEPGINWLPRLGGSLALLLTNSFPSTAWERVFERALRVFAALCEIDSGYSSALGSLALLLSV